MIGSILEFFLLLMSHAAAGIWSSAPKYSKKTTFLIWGIWVAAQSVLMLCAELFMTHLALHFFVSFVLTFAGQYVIFFRTTTGKLEQRIFTMLTYSVFFCISISLFNIVAGTFPDRSPALSLLIYASTLFGVMFYFLRYVCPLCRAAAANISSGWKQLICISVLFLITLILSSVFPVRLTSLRDEGCLAYIFLSISILAVYPVIFSNLNNMEQESIQREIQRQNKLLLALVDAENQQIAADRQARHDRRHHILVMLEMANNSDLEGVRAYLKLLTESEGQVWSEIRFCNNMTVNTLLTAYTRRASENGVDARISASVSRDLAIEIQDLVIVVANLFENALNAVEKLKGKEKFVQVSIKETPQRLLIKIENACREKMTFDESEYGVGIRSVISTVNKYNGMYDFSAEDGIFSAKISLNVK